MFDPGIVPVVGVAPAVVAGNVANAVCCAENCCAFTNPLDASKTNPGGGTYAPEFVSKFPMLGGGTYTPATES